MQRRAGTIRALQQALDPGRDGGRYDEAGRRILGGYQAISDFLTAGMMQA